MTLGRSRKILLNTTQLNADLALKSVSLKRCCWSRACFTIGSGGMHAHVIWSLLSRTGAAVVPVCSVSFYGKLIALTSFPTSMVELGGFVCLLFVFFAFVFVEANTH